MNGCPWETVRAIIDDALLPSEPTTTPGSKRHRTHSEKKPDSPVEVKPPGEPPDKKLPEPPSEKPLLEQKPNPFG